MPGRAPEARPTPAPGRDRSQALSAESIGLPPPSPSAPLIRAEGLVHRFRDGQLGLDRVSLELKKGELVLLAGRNGSGKSLLARHLAGLSAAQEGRILVRGRPAAAASDFRAFVGLVFQDAEAQIIGQTLIEDAAFGPANLGLSRPEVLNRASEALRRVGLGDRAGRSVEGLSGGEKRRLAIAGALALGPEILILDEPFANLDYPAITSLLGLILELKTSGVSILLITHELEKVLAHPDRLVLMEGGRVRYDGSPAYFPGHGYEPLGLRNPFRGGLSLKELSWLD